MDNLVFSLNATLPVFMIIFLGWIFKKKNIINDEFVATNNKLAFNVLFPVLLFKDISQTEINESFDVKFFLACFLMTVLSVMLITIFARFYIKEKKMLGSFIQGSFRSSAAILGVSMAENLYGNAGLVPVMIIAAVPFYNFYSVIILTLSSEDADKKIDIKKLMLSIVKNPMIISIFLGIPFSVLNINFPFIIDKTINNLASIATPLALLIVGAGFDSSDGFKEKIKPCAVASFIKLVVQPGIFLPIAVLLGFREQELIAMLIMLGSPSTVSGFIMAKSMKNDSELASGIVVVTTVISAFTITGSIYILKSFGFI